MHAEEYGGPFNVDVRKPYKPVFICYVDLIIAITFFSFTLLTYWNDLNVDQSIHDFYNFLPPKIVLFQVLLFIKFFIDVFFLVICFDDKVANRSHSTGSLFWFRVFFDITLFGGILFSSRYIMQNNSGRVGYVKLGLLMPKVLIEVFVYNISVKPAFRRSVYQSFSEWKKGGPSPLEEEKKKNDFFKSLERNLKLQQEKSEVDKVSNKKAKKQFI